MHHKHAFWQADSSDVTACHWKIIPCKKIFQELSQRERSGVALQFWSKKHSKDHPQNGLFLIIEKDGEFRLRNLSFVRDCGVFHLN